MIRGVQAGGLLGLIALIALAWPAAGQADHVSITVATTARLAERASSDSWVVEVSWSATCNGAAGSASYSGSLYLVDSGTGERIYLGGVSSGSGTVRQLVGARPTIRFMHPELKLSCYEYPSLHGSESVVASGADVPIPPLFDEGGGGGGNGGPGGGGGGSGSGDPTEPLQSGGCVQVILGGSGPDTLDGQASGEVIFGLAGDDLIRGNGGHDCLLGEAGNDKLFGNDGSDRLTGGAGKDELTGGPGVNAYDAGPGKDYVNARNGKRELIRCGSGRDRARVDRRDRVKSCEKVSRPRS